MSLHAVHSAAEIAPLENASPLKKKNRALSSKRCLNRTAGFSHFLRSEEELARANGVHVTAVGNQNPRLSSYDGQEICRFLDSDNAIPLLTTVGGRVAQKPN